MKTRLGCLVVGSSSLIRFGCFGDIADISLPARMLVKRLALQRPQRLDLRFRDFQLIGR